MRRDLGCLPSLWGARRADWRAVIQQGPRKDCDILFYRIRQRDSIDLDGLWEALRAIGVERTRGWGWCHKATWNGKAIDMFFPENDGGEYKSANTEESLLIEEMFA